MSDQQRLLLASVLMALVLVLGWNLTARRAEHPATSPVQTADTPADSMETTAPSVVSDTAAPAAFDSLTQAARSIAVLVRSDDGRDLVRASITTLGGAVESWTLPEYRSLHGGSGPLDLVAAPWFVTTGADGNEVPFGCEAPDTLVIAGAPDSVVLVEYPSRQAFLEMVARPDYLKSHEHRESGLERTVVLACTPTAPAAQG